MTTHEQTQQTLKDQGPDLGDFEVVTISQGEQRGKSLSSIRGHQAPGGRRRARRGGARRACSRDPGRTRRDRPRDTRPKDGQRRRRPEKSLGKG